MASAASSHFDLAVLGADEPLGESFLKALEDQEIAVGQLLPLSMSDDPDTNVTFRGEEWPCDAVKGFDFARAQALVVVAPQRAAEAVVARVRKNYPAMPVLSLQEVTPGPAVAIARLLKVIKAVVGPVKADAFVALPVAMAGKAGVEELLNQSRGLFNMESPDPEVFPLQMAFNVLPIMDSATPRYGSQVLSAAVKAASGIDSVGFSVAWAPLFFGASTALHMRANTTFDLPALRAALKHQDGILLMESDLPAGNPTPATDSAESADIFLGQIRAEGESLQIWLVYDPLRLEAVQMVDTVENWIDKPVNSMLT